MRKVLIAAACVAVPAVALSQWAQEPSTAFDVPLGSPIAAGMFPKCPNPPWETKVRCLETSAYSSKIATLWNTGLGSMTNGSASVFFDDGVVSSVHVGFNHDHYAQMKAALIERYGRPTKVETSKATNRMGASATAETLIWTGRVNSLTLLERFDTLDKSLAAFTNNASVVRGQQQRNQDAKADAAKF